MEQSGPVSELLVSILNYLVQTNSQILHKKFDKLSTDRFAQELGYFFSPEDLEVSKFKDSSRISEPQKNPQRN